MGNKDSVEIGYDPLATDTTDVAFGETESPVTTPFDSLFEARLTTHLLGLYNVRLQGKNKFYQQKLVVE